MHRNYEAICAAVLRFLDAYLKGDAQVARVAAQSRRGGRPAHRCATRRRSNLCPPPRRSPKSIRHEGPSNMEALSALVKDAEPDLLTGASDLLQEEGRKREAVGLLTWAAPILPKSALLRTALGEALAGIGDKAGAREGLRTGARPAAGRPYVGDIPEGEIIQGHRGRHHRAAQVTTATVCSGVYPRNQV